MSSSWLDVYFSHKGNNNRSIQKEQQQSKSKDASILECWTTLSSLAPITKTIRLGAILVNLHRNPAVTAKMLATLDVISNGRIEFGLSSGWYEKEINSYGIPFPDASTRVEMLEEGFVIIKKMLTEEQTSSFNGKYYVIKEAECRPKPIQKPHPPMWIGGGGKKTLELVARYADGWNYGLCTYGEFLDKISILKDHCDSIGRNYEDIIKAWHGVMLLSNENVTEGELINRILINAVWKKNLDSFIIGSPQKIIKEICRYMDLGVDYFVIHFPDLPNTQSLELFAKYVIEYFRY